MSKAKIISAHSALLQPIDRDYNYNGGQRQEHFEVKQDEISHALRAGQSTFVLIVSNNEIKKDFYE